jgi:hypothetical protein
MIIFRLDDKAVQCKLFGVHVNLENLRTVVQFTNLEDYTAALFGAVFLQFTDLFLLTLLFGQLA